MQNPANSNLVAEDSANPTPIGEKSRRGLYIFSVFLLFWDFCFSALVSRHTHHSATIDESPHILAGHRRRAHIPFGGVKMTGIGAREQGSTALNFYTELKIVYVGYTGRRREGNLY